MKKNIRNNSSSRSIGKSGNQNNNKNNINNNEIGRKSQNENQEFYENEEENRFANKRNHIPKINSNSSRGNKLSESNFDFLNFKINLFIFEKAFVKMNFVLRFLHQL